MTDQQLGGQTVTIVRRVPRLDSSGKPVLSEIGVAQTVEQTVDVANCLFEIQDMSPGAAELETSTTTVHAVAWCVMPVTADTRVIPSTAAIRYGGRDWQMRGDGRLEHDLDGNEDHVFCLLEGQRG